MGARREEAPEQPSTVFAVEEVAHCLTTGFVGLSVGPAFFGADAASVCGTTWFRGCFFRALGASVSEAGFVGFELELLFADSADFDGERHFGLQQHFKSTRSLVRAVWTEISDRSARLDLDLGGMGEVCLLC
jgi:hypothetical protein